MSGKHWSRVCVWQRRPSEIQMSLFRSLCGTSALPAASEASAETSFATSATDAELNLELMAGGG